MNNPNLSRLAGNTPKNPKSNDARVLPIKIKKFADLNIIRRLEFYQITA